VSNSFALDDSDLQYNSISLGCSSSSVEGYSQKVNQLSVGGTYLLNDNIYLGGGLSSATFSRPKVTQVNYAGVDIFVGYRIGISRTTDITLSADYSSTDITEAGYSGITQNAVSAGLGLRSLVSPNIELGTGVSLVNYQNESTTSSVALSSGTATQFSAGIKYFLSKEFALRGAYGYSSSNSSNGKTYTSNSVGITGLYYFQ